MEDIYRSRYCLTAAAGREQSRLTVTSGMRWFKSPLVKSIIRNVTLRSISDYLKDYLEVIWKEIGKIKPATVATVQKTSTNSQPEGVDALTETIPTAERQNSTVISVRRVRFASAWKVTKEILINISERKVSLLWSIIFMFLGCLFIGSLVLRRYKVSNLSESLASQLASKHKIPHILYSDPLLQLFDKEIVDAQGDFAEIRREILSLLTDLDHIEGGLATLQTALHLADQLATCYSNPLVPLTACARLESRWSGLLQKVLHT